MKKGLQQVIVAIIGAMVTGCIPLSEWPRSLWGSSTYTLERARPEGARQTFTCEYDRCFDSILALTYTGKFKTDLKDKPFRLFMQNRAARHIVIMGVYGSVDTTEVGIFLDPVSDRDVQVEIASLSSNARIKAAGLIFKALAEQYPAPEDEARHD